MAFLAAPFAAAVGAELGTAVATEVGFAVGSETVGAAVGGAVTAKVAGEINKKADEVGAAALNKAVGFNVQEKVGQANQLLNDFMNDLTSGKRYGTTATSRSGRPIPQQQGVIHTGRVAQQAAKPPPPPSLPQPGAQPQQQNQIEGAAYTKHMNPLVVGSSVDVEQDLYANGKPPAGKIIPFLNDTSGTGYQGINLQTGSKQVAIPTPQINESSAKDLASFIAKSNLSLSLTGDPQSYVHTAVSNPSLIPVVKTYQDTKIPELATFDSLYAGVSQVYHGRGITPKNAFINQEGKYCFRDETGTVEVYTGESAPKGTSTLGLIALGFTPPLHGTWMGPNSPNNALPLDLLDTFSMAHDIEYGKKGWFSLEADLKYISRLKNNLHRFDVRSKILAEFAIKWFTTVGYAAAKIKANLPDNVNKVPTNQSGSDFYTLNVQKDQLKNVPKTAYSQGRPDPAYTTVSPILRTKFYDEFTKQLDKEYVEAAPFTTDPMDTRSLWTQPGMAQSQFKQIASRLTVVSVSG